MEDSFSTKLRKRTYAHLNDDYTKYYAYFQQEASSVILVLNPSNGNLTEAKHIAYPEAIDGRDTATFAGKFSQNKILMSISSTSPSYHFLDIIDTDTWERNSYSTSNLYVLYGASTIFNTNQIILSYAFVPTLTSIDRFTIQAAYDKLHLTEMFVQSSNTLTDVTSNYTFTDFTFTLNQNPETAATLTVTVNDATLNTNSDKSYKVNANVFSQNTETYTGTVNTTASIGPVQYDCYEVVASSTSSNFTNQLTLLKSDGSALPNWMTFDSTSGIVSTSVPSEISSDTYKINNLYTGELGNSFTLSTNLTIRIVEAEDKDYCFDASSKFMCGFFISLIILTGFILVIVFIVILYSILKKKLNQGVTKVDQDDANDANEVDGNQYEIANATEQQNSNLKADEEAIHVIANDEPDNQV